MTTIAARRGSPSGVLTLKPWPTTLFAALFGFFLGLALVKWGNPVVLDHLVRDSSRIPGFGIQDQSAGRDWQRSLFDPWPIKHGLAMLVGLAVLGAGVYFYSRRQARSGSFSTRTNDAWPLLALFGGWFGWQVLSSFQSVHPLLSQITLLHFGGCAACLLAGFLLLGRAPNLTGFWIGLAGGLCLVYWQGLGQHYGGLEALRRFIQEQSGPQSYPEELIRRIMRDRIFSTLVYPNALAGVILLLHPVVTVAMWNWTARMGNVFRGVITGLFAYTGLACLYWTGSKAGHLIAVILAVAVILNSRISRCYKNGIIIAVIGMGLAGFIVKYAQYFRGGATSVSARVTYWKSAIEIAVDNPVFGVGPGAFSIPFQKIKPPEAEMARLVHNDYLEQAADSGFCGFILYGSFIGSSMVLLYRKSRSANLWYFFPVWLGLFGWTIQGLVEFGLYIPALAWPTFALIGLLAGIDESPSRSVSRSAE
ncbi:MAG TPA: O-antigen ligase family protein [Candidatus Paceibacterota bacterium]|nr:O-antigen ligase family protein [Verrucomicrobiota bacterium]HRZ43826.1 O-antigen ligase family protein [Candidatus Paceibacterota bacterium]